MTMTYDPLGRLSSITRGGITTDLLYDGAFLAGAYNPDGAISARYVPGPGADEPLTVYTGSGTSSVAWYVPDQEGSIIATADQNANATAQYAYDPYGAPLNSAGTITWSGPRYGYTGQIELNDAQTYFYKARMYDPATGRFFQTDPAGFAGGINLYAYATDDPVNGWDFSGLDSIDYTDLGNGCVQTTDYWSIAYIGEDGALVNGYHSTSVSCSSGSSTGSSRSLGNQTGGAAGRGSAPSGAPKPSNCATGIAIANALDKASKAAGAGALGLGVAGAGIEAGSLGTATPAAAAAEATAGVLEVASFGLGALSAVTRSVSTGNFTSLGTFALSQGIVNATGLSGISTLGRSAQRLTSVIYDNGLANAAPQSTCR
jgi:RHS repeat-associated protein